MDCYLLCNLFRVGRKGAWKAMTNREWINSLSNEDFVMGIIAPCSMCANKGKDCTRYIEMNCYEGLVKWLEQEHEGSEKNENNS